MAHLILFHQAVHVGNAPMRSHPAWALQQVPARYVAPYASVADEQRRLLSGMVAALDESVGNLTAALHAAAMWERTLLVFSTDNGGPTSQAASNYPLRGGKATCWEGGTRGVGFVVGGARSGLSPGVRGGESRSMIHVTDWLPTLCEAAGCSRQEGGGGALRGATKPLDGVSAWGAISRGEVGTRTEFLISLIEVSGAPALRVGDYKCARHVESKARHASAIIKGAEHASPALEGATSYARLRPATAGHGQSAAWATVLRWPYTHTPDRAYFRHRLLGRPPQLFNLRDDPRESNDLAVRMPAKVAELQV